MDGDVSRWILEFLLRSSVPDSLMQKIVTLIPVSDGDLRLKKALLLRTLQSHLYKASVPETILGILEVIEEIDRNDFVSVTETMKQAYCAIAVECTVKYLGACPDNSGGEYFDAVKRIWRGRVKEMDTEAVGCRSELLSSELTRWRDEIEAALWDSGVCERLANMNSRRDALNKLNGYLKEAWEIMGPSFLDSVATLSKVKGLRSMSEKAVRDERVAAEGHREELNVGVSDIDVADAEPMSKCDGRLESLANTRMNIISGDRIDLDDGACPMEEAPVTVERVEASVDGSGGLRECDLPKRREKAIQKGKLLLKHKHSAHRRCHKGIKISAAEEDGPSKPSREYDPIPSPEFNGVRESLKSSSLELKALVKDPLPDALHTSEVVRSEMAMKDVNQEPSSENLSQSRGVNVADPDICKSIVLYQPNGANLGKKSSVHCSNVGCPNLMERKSTARVYEWDDSIENAPHGAQPKRRKRKWTSLEEDTLRAGVRKFGEGNWTTIRNFYSNIFSMRSGVDLKDKWRNMMR